jgi:hypothetical protein
MLEGTLRPDNLRAVRRFPQLRPLSLPAAAAAAPLSAASADRRSARTCRRPRSGGGQHLDVHRRPNAGCRFHVLHLYWFWFYFSWTAAYLALSYSITVQEQERRAAELTVKAQEAQVSALRYQINPHFLFNTLNAIAALVRDAPARAEEMVVQLSDFFRRSLAINPAEDVTLAQEVDLQRLYLEIERTRFPERLRFDVALDDGSAEARVPALLLQPLVENAVKHGVAGRKADLHSNPRPSGRPVLEIVVENDAAASRAGRSGEKVGLRNVAERLRSRFGDDASLATGEIADGRFPKHIAHAASPLTLVARHGRSSIFAPLPAAFAISARNGGLDEEDIVDRRGLAALLASPKAAWAQRTGENAVASAQDAFGTSVGNERVGLYFPQSARGFSPVQAGNVRINGLYFDYQTDLNQRLISGSNVRVGLSAGLSVSGADGRRRLFVAPAGIGGRRQHRGRDRPLRRASRGSRRAASRHRYARVAAGVGVNAEEIYYGGRRRLVTAAAVARWRPAENVEIIPVLEHAGQSRPRGGPIIFTAGAISRPKSSGGAISAPNGRRTIPRASTTAFSPPSVSATGLCAAAPSAPSPTACATSMSCSSTPRPRARRTASCFTRREAAPLPLRASCASPGS